MGGPEGFALTSECARRFTCCDHLIKSPLAMNLVGTQKSGLQKCLYQDVRSNLCNDFYNTLRLRGNAEASKDFGLPVPLFSVRFFNKVPNASESRFRRVPGFHPESKDAGIRSSYRLHRDRPG